MAFGAKTNERPGTRAEVKIRYHHAAAGCRLHPLEDGRVEVRFDAPQPAVTPGQLAVFYLGERVLGGASIERALNGEPVAERAAAPGQPTLDAAAAP